MNYTPDAQGMYQIPIVEFGNRLQDNFGLRVREHSAFGPVGRHANNSYHYYDEAIDVTDHRGGEGLGAEGFNGVGYVQRTKNLRDRLRGIGPEVIGPGDMKGHDTHLHLAAKDGIFNLNEDQYNYFYGGNAGGTSATFKGLGAPPVVSTTSVADRPAAAQKAKDYSSMSKGQLDKAYDNMRSDPAKAREEGMKMHKAFFKNR